jgi:multidrug efflux system outer membrane protein
MTCRSLLIATAASLALAGCNLAPAYVRPGSGAPATLPQGGVYPAAATDAPDVSTIGWRTFFTDPKLQQVIALGLENNRDLQIAAGNVLQARAQYRIQRADRFPGVAATGSATYTNNPLGALGGGAVGGAGAGAVTGSSGNIEIYQVNAGISAFELDLFGRVRNLSKAALEQYFATEEAQRATRISLIAEIASAYATMAADQDQLRIAEQTLESFARSLELTRAQFRIGTASELEARQSETNYEGARNDIAALKTQIARDQNALNLLVGTTVTADLLPAGLGRGDVTLSDLPAGIRSDVLLRRPDVLQAEHQLIAQNANIGAARAAFFPRISLTATIGTLSTALGGLFGGGTDVWNVAPSASLPLFDFGRTKGNLRFAEASRTVAVATYQRAVQTAFREVADALAQRGTITEQVRAREARANAAAVAARLSDARYRAGVDSFLTSLDAQRTSYAAQQDVVTTRLARISNLVELYRSLGGGIG